MYLERLPRLDGLAQIIRTRFMAPVIVSGLSALNRLDNEIGDESRNACLAELQEDDALALIRCLRRLGYWFPDSTTSPHDRITEWLFGDDIIKFDYSNGTESRRVETPEERVKDALRDLETIEKASRITSDCCLNVASYLFNGKGLFNYGNKDWPPEFWPKMRLGTMLNSTHDPSRLEELRHRDFCYRFDGEVWAYGLSDAMKRLGTTKIELSFPDLTADPRDDENSTRQELENWFERCRVEWRHGIFDQKELPDGWELRSRTLVPCTFDAHWCRCTLVP